MRWRAMETGDLDGVVAVAAIAFPDHPESRACFAERLALFPELAFVLTEGSHIAGYLIAYPWPLGAIPPLDSLLGSLPEAPGAFYLHDLALLPEARGGGHARTILGTLFAHAAGTPIALVSVNGSADFWARHGFVARESARLASYGPDARYMVRDD